MNLCKNLVRLVGCLETPECFPLVKGPAAVDGFFQSLLTNSYLYCQQSDLAYTLLYDSMFSVWLIQLLRGIGSNFWLGGEDRRSEIHTDRGHGFLRSHMYYKLL